MTRSKAKKLVDAWNTAHPIGTPVTRYKLMDPLREPTQTKTRSEAVVADSGTPVIWVSGIAGYVHLQSIEAIKS